jgi:multidrug transporter EmrE-like cation transporter
MIGEYFSKMFSIKPSIKMGILVIGLYSFCSICWLPVVYYAKGITIVGMLWSAITALTTIFMGVIIFKEHVEFHHYIGIICSLIGIILLSY